MELSEDDYCYVYLEFNEKISSTIFGNKMFLRIANLHKPNPLVQINDLLFKGSYDECVGTNLFFEELEDPPLKTNIFEQNPPIRLKPTITQTKTIKLKQVKLPRQASNRKFKESIVLNLNQDYNTVLERLEQGILNVEDLGLKEPKKSLEEQFEDLNFEASEELSTEPEKEIESVLEGADKSPGGLLEAKYERLKRLIRRPVKRMKSPELVEECEPQFRNAFEYHNVERQICQNSDAFRSVTGPLVEKSFVGGVDIDRCILQGSIPRTTDFNHVLTKEVQRRIFTLANFENLSLPARYLVLKEYASQIEDLIEHTPTEELKETDESGRTIKDMCDIFRRLVRALELTMAQSVEEVNPGTSFSLRTQLPESPEEYVKYKYKGEELFEPSKDMFDVEAWVVQSEPATVEKSGDFVDSDDSMGMDQT